MSDTIRFFLDGKVVCVSDIDPTRTVLQYLREDCQRLGTKEGCAEGDCGACTVVVAELDSTNGQLSYKAINSCIQFLPTLHGKALLTVENLASENGTLHPIQRAMVECHGSQCGFCTPGFVMSMFAMYKTQPLPSRQQIDVALAGNLCRCTGYRPIVDAAVKMYEMDEPGSQDEPDELEIVRALQTLDHARGLHLEFDDRQYFAPANISDFAQLYETYPQAHILAGGTDIGLWVTKQYQELNTIIYVGNVRELLEINLTSDHMDIGAAVTLSDVMPVLVRHYPDLEELFQRFASPPIRNAGTLGGNVANGSPIGDSMPALIVLGASVVLRKGHVTRDLPLDEYYQGYMQTAAHPGEFVDRIRIPLPAKNQTVRAYKLSKRFDQDISAVCGAYSLILAEGRIEHIRIAYGGLAATPKRARQCESVLQGKIWDETALHEGMAALDEDFDPISDMRASAGYRRLACKNLLHRFYLESRGYAGKTNVYSYSQ